MSSKISRRSCPGFNKFLLLVLQALLIILVSACQPAVRDRPYGDIRLGKITELLDAEKFLPNAQLILRRDQRGWSAMSTLCTHDLSELSQKSGGNGPILSSQFSDSTYAMDGKVLSGPAVKDLPYYKLFIDEGLYGGPKDTLYARIGEERSKEWRLVVPSEALQ